MSVIIKYTPITGTLNSDPLCYLLQVDDVKFLLDCGWYDTFDVEALSNLKKIAKFVDYVLISHPDLEHIGALPYACAKLGLSSSNIFCTGAAALMGRMNLLDAFHCRNKEEDFTTFTAQDVDTVFDRIQKRQIKYKQHIQLTGKARGIVITAFQAGHTLGGALWRISKENQEIVYAVNFNDKREKHLESIYYSEILRPSLLITDARNALKPHSNRDQLKNELDDCITRTVHRGGNVLIPTDAASRGLEIAFVLEQLWQEKKYPHAIYFLSPMSKQSITYAQSLLEYMNRNFTKEQRDYKADGVNRPFDFRHIQLVQNLDLILDPNFQHIPKIVLATMSTLNTGLSLDLFTLWSSSQANTIIFTQQPQPQSLAAVLFNQPSMRLTKLNRKKRIPLQGEELNKYLLEKKRQQEKELRENAVALKEVGTAQIAEEEEEETPLVTGSFDLFVRGIANNAGANFAKQNFKLRSFPLEKPDPKFDDYGMVIDYNMFPRESTVKDEDRMQQEQTEEKVDIPTKTVISEDLLLINCERKYLDYEGLADGMACARIIKDIAPRKLILINGDQKSTSYMHELLSNVSDLTKDIMCPQVGETIDASSMTNIYQVLLTDALLRSIPVTKCGDYGVAYVKGVITSSEETDIPLFDVPFIEGEKQDQVTSKELTKRVQGVNFKHKPILVGELSILKLEKQLLQQNMDIKSGNGILVCNSAVEIKKTENGKFILEGFLSRDYFKMRSLIYEQHVAV